jgi:hypothetical protein
MRIFEKLHFRQQHQVITWPAFSALGEYEQRIGFPSADYASEATPHMLDWLPGERRGRGADDADRESAWRPWRVPVVLGRGRGADPCCCCGVAMVERPPTECLGR